MAEILTDGERRAVLGQLEQWRYDEDAKAIRRDFKFGNFSQTFAFMTRVALLAEKHGHHPDWSNSYNSVSVAFSTHSAGGLTEKDIAMARAVDAL